VGGVMGSPVWLALPVLEKSSTIASGMPSESEGEKAVERFEKPDEVEGWYVCGAKEERLPLRVECESERAKCANEDGADARFWMFMGLEAESGGEDLRSCKRCRVTRSS